MASRQGIYSTQEERAKEASEIGQWREMMKIKTGEVKEQPEYLRQEDKRLRSKWTEEEMVKLLDDAMSS